MLASTKFVSRLDMATARIDREQGIIKGVSLVSVGEARGYSQWADHKTLEQVRDCARQYRGGLRVKFNPRTFNHGDGSLAGRIPGESLGFVGHGDSEQLVGDLHVYQHLDSREYLFEIAETAPDNCGLSIHFGGVPEEIDGKRFARCEEIFDATLVDLPAANKRGLFKANDQEGNATMTEDEMKKLGAAFASAIQPIIAKENAKVIAAFRSANGNGDDGSEPSDEEKQAAGVADGDDDDTIKAKVSAWRKTGNEPVTMKSLMQFFRFTGNRAAKVSGEPNASGDATSDFESRIQKYRAAGMGSGKAIRRASQDDPKGYNEWALKNRPDVPTVKGS